VKLPCATHLIITGITREILETQVLPKVEEFLRERGLELSKEKTRVTHIKEGFDFLGQNLRKYKDKLIVKPSKKSIKTILEKIRTQIKANQTAAQENLIKILNPIIRGWTNYHRHCAAKKTFQRIDHEIWQKLQRWCRRRHPNKGARWIKKKYFHTISGKNWVFASGRKHQTGETLWTHLFYAGEVQIKRHIKIKGKANPFDPEWYRYFGERSYYKEKERPRSKEAEIIDILFGFV